MAVVLEQPSGEVMSINQQQCAPLCSPVMVAQPTSFVSILTTDANHPRGVPRPWSTKLCSCFDDCCGCLLAMLCHPCYLCHVSTKMGEDCCAPCCLSNALVVMRAHTRARHNIQGSLINDACTSCWCGCCALCQLSRELDNIHSGRALP